MKKRYLIGFTFVWLFIFSLAAHASVTSSRKEVVPAVKLTDAKASVEGAKDNKAEETLISNKELLEYVKNLEESLKNEENRVVEEIGNLTLTEGIGKKRVKLFTGTKKLLGKGTKDDRVNLVLFYLVDTAGTEKETVILQENSYEIGASRLFSAEITLSRTGVNYLLVQVESDGQEQAQLYQIVVEDTKTKDKLESMTLQFTK